MHRGVALTLSIGAAALAVVVVAVDLQFNVEVSFETKQDGEWRVIATTVGDVYASPRFEGYFGCAAPEMRIVIANGLPWATSQEVVVRVIDHSSGRDEVLVQRTVEVAPSATEIIPFTAPAWATEPSGDGKDLGSASVDVRVGDSYFGTCLEAP